MGGFIHGEVDMLGHGLVVLGGLELITERLAQRPQNSSRLEVSDAGRTAEYQLGERAIHSGWDLMLERILVEPGRTEVDRLEELRDDRLLLLVLRPVEAELRQEDDRVAK